MVELDAVAPRVTPDGARISTIDFTAFDLNNDRHFVPGAGRVSIDYLPAQGGSIAIFQRDILRVGRRGRTDALGSGGLVVACRRVIDVDREGARMIGDFEGVAAVGRDGNLGGGSGGGPHLGIAAGGNGPPRCGIVLCYGITGRGGYLAADGGGVGFISWGFISWGQGAASTEC